MTEVKQPTTLQPKNYASDQEIRWCPGCGDYAIIKAVQKTCADLELARHETVFVSGIGCAARFPYYMDTYGFHTIHGRAPAVATGVKLANPHLDVWVIGGDGDLLSIGGNHLMHVLRRNVDLTVLLFNNEIYGLTKGQYSPTSRPGTRSPSTPTGSLDNPVSAARYALGSGGRFVARAVDTQQKRLPGILRRAHDFQGTGFVEIFQNCIVYNDAVFSHFTDREIADERQIHVEHGEKLIFGGDRDMGLRFDPETLRLDVVQPGKDGITEADILVHDETNPTLATLLATMEPPDLPVALGVLYCAPAPSYETQVADQIAAFSDGRRPGVIGGDIEALLRSGHTWTHR
jgi:2-oxoglutarate ferredoxin oxidoreductase subunit beta